MTTRADVNRLSAASSRVVELARRDLEAAFRSLNLANPEAVRNALLEIVPALTREYGDVAATVAAEWYEEARAAQVGSTFNARLADGFPADEMQSTVRREAGHLWGDDQFKTLSVLAGSIQRFVMYSTRSTVAHNAELDPANPMFARVPRGSKTCAFCTMLASRGFAYYTKESAGGEWNHFHDDCRCQIVSEWDKDAHHIEGYDPDAMFAKYEAARQAAGSGDPRAILAEMRRMYPQDFTDGVIEAVA